MAHQKDPNWMVSGDIAGYEDIVLGDNREGGSPWFMSKDVDSKLAALGTTRAELNELEIPLWQRDKCVGKLIPWNRCLKKPEHLGWNVFTNPCSHEQHAYDRCQYYLAKELRLKKRNMEIAKDRKELEASRE